jgi:hypothetical protein
VSPFYVAQTNLKGSHSKEHEEKLTNLNHIIILLKAGIKVSKTEKSNYDKFVLQLQTNGIEQSALETTPFVHFDIIEKIDKKSIFNSITLIQTNKHELAQETYLDIIKQSSNALFIKRNSEIMYENFIKSFNEPAKNYVAAGFQLNDLYIQLTNNQSSDLVFDQRFFTIIHQYNTGMSTGAFNPNLIPTIFQYLHDPLVQLCISRGINNPEKVKLIQIMKQFEVSLNKMDDITKNLIIHFSQLSKDLDYIIESLSTILDKITVLRTNYYLK